MTPHPTSADDDRATHTPERPAAVLRSLPGRARPRKEALQEYEQESARLGEGLPAGLGALLVPEAEQLYRWRIQLDCGCIHEVWTRGEEDLPSERRRHGPEQEQLQKGQMLCVHDDGPPARYQNIVEWGERTEHTFPADPVEPRHGLSPQEWAAMRHDKPHTRAFWKVTLACGHITDTIAPSLEWKPADGPRLTDADRVAEMTEEFEEFWASNPTGQSPREREHTRRVLAQGWPRPEPEELCYTCRWVRWIMAYQRIGWLIPRAKQPQRQQPPSRATLERRLRQMEAEAKQLRTQLAQLDSHTEDRPQT
ncbi:MULTISPECIES: hypothetical protein [unclassified Streptomyces]|uniref:hypothetical protein n=1 Tax=unclassified Streptomyces TaxID=2593676 RepID=UPI003247EDA7